MKNKKITRKITQGVYALTTKNGGCIVDAVSQVSAGETPFIAVSVKKENYTNSLLKENTKFALSVLPKELKEEVISIFGFQSAKEIDKFANVETEEIEGIKVLKNSLGYMICEKINQIELETHTLFIGKLIEADLYKEEEPLSYAYYQEHKEEYVKVKLNEHQSAYICTVCGYVYYGEELPQDFTCPVCKVSKDYFKKQES